MHKAAAIYCRDLRSACVLDKSSWFRNDVGMSVRPAGTYRNHSLCQPRQKRPLQGTSHTRGGL